MSDTESRTARFRGRSPPDRDDEWEVSTVARCGTNQSDSAVCAATDANVSLDEAHYLVKIRRPVVGLLRDYEYDDLIVADGAIDELDDWLEGQLRLSPTVNVDVETLSGKPQPTPAMYDRTPQEDLLVVEALVEYHADRIEVQPGRACRAWVIAKEIAAIHGLEIEDALRQRDEI